MLELARVITLGALAARREPRRALQAGVPASATTPTSSRPPRRAGRSDGPEFSYEPVDVSLIKPRPRKYDVDK